MIAVQLAPGGFLARPQAMELIGRRVHFPSR
jgi:hypothetical protein